MPEFTTKDSGERKVQPSGMQRDTNTGKARFDLMWPKGIPYDEQFMTRIAMLMARGAEKYDPRNWEKGDFDNDYDRAMESAERHLQQYKCGDRSEDHAAGVVFNLLAAVTYEYKHTRKADGLFSPTINLPVELVSASTEGVEFRTVGCGCSSAGPCYDDR